MYEQGELGIKRRTLKNTIKYAIKSIITYSREAELFNQKGKGDQAYIYIT